MLTRRLIPNLVILVGGMIALAALAADAPALPASAKKLGHDEMVAFLDGKTFHYRSYNHADVVMGTTRFDFKKMKFSGTYNGKPYTPMDLGVSGDGYCYDKSCSTPVFLYIDRNTAYEADDSGKVHEILTK